MSTYAVGLRKLSNLLNAEQQRKAVFDHKLTIDHAFEQFENRVMLYCGSDNQECIKNAYKLARENEGLQGVFNDANRSNDLELSLDRAIANANGKGIV